MIRRYNSYTGSKPHATISSFLSGPPSSTSWNRGPRRRRAQAQYGAFRYLYAEITAVTASPHPVTIRFSLFGYHTASPHANTPGTDVLMSGRTLMFRAPSSSKPHRSTFVWSGSKPTLMMIESTRFTTLSNVTLLYTTASRPPLASSMLTSSELYRTFTGDFWRASTFFSIARNSPRRWTRVTSFAGATSSSAISRALSPPPTTRTVWSLKSRRSLTR